MGRAETDFRSVDWTGTAFTPNRSKAMRFMVMVPADKDSEAGVLPTEQQLTEMMQYNEQLVKAGIMLAGEGLQPSSKGARIAMSLRLTIIVMHARSKRIPITIEPNETVRA